MSQEKNILYRQCALLWMPVFFGSFLLYSGVVFLVLVQLSGDVEVEASIGEILAMMLAFLTSPVVDAIYFEIRDYFIMKRYEQALAEEDAARG
jgi:hypothetical protein